MMSALKGQSYFLVLAVCAVCPLMAQDSTTIVRSYEMMEEEDVGFILMNLGTDTGLSTKYDSDTLDSLQYSFLTESQQYSSLFTIRPNGDLATATQVDRDSRCANEAECEILIDIQVQPVDYFHIIKLTISLLDMNDNSPRFPEDITLNIPESSPVGTRLAITPIAEDPDSPQNGIVRYTLDDPSGKFELQVAGGSDGPPEPELKLLEVLDHEDRQTYKMEITAYDAGTQPRSGSTQLVVDVIDVNDHAAQFLNKTYSVSIKENLGRNTPILQVAASDADSGLNGEIVYGFTTRTATEIQDIFAINPSTGVITIIGELDYEVQQSYSLTVTARDKVPTSVPDQAKVTVTIEDTNDNSPAIVINTLVGRSSIDISEYTEIDTFVAHISVKDADSGANAHFVCSLSSDVFRLEKFYDGEYKVFTRELLDRETKPRYDIEINCSDKGSPIRSASATIPFVLLDENDNPPKFDVSSYNKTVKENNTIGAALITVHASDLDAGENATVTYSLAGSENGLFSIHPSSGAVIATGKLDREKKEQEIFTVVATDNGHPSKSTTAEVTLTIEDIDDEAPTFLQSMYEFNVIEDQSTNVLLGQVKAIDKDTDRFNSFSFSLNPAFNRENKFRIDPVSGEIFCMATLDREEIAEYSLRVLATGFDNGQGVLSSSVVVNVLVTDINDWDPVFIFPRYPNTTVNVSADVEPGETFAKISALDNDTGTNAQLYYSIINSSGPIMVNSLTGALSFMESEEPLQESYVLHVKVEDYGAIPRSDQSKLTVNCSAILYGAAPTAVKPQNLTIVIIITVVSAVVIVGLILGIVCIVRGSWFRTKKPPHTDGTTLQPSEPVKTEQDLLAGYSGVTTGYQNGQYDNRGYSTDTQQQQQENTNNSSKKTPIRYSSLQIPSTDIRPRDPVYLRQHHSDSVQPQQQPMGAVLLGGHLHPLPPRAASAPPTQPRPLHVKTSEGDSDQSRDSDSGRGSNEEVASEPGSPRWTEGGAKGGAAPPPPPKPPRRPSLRTAHVLPGIHEGKVLSSTSMSDPTAPYDRPPPRPYHHHPHHQSPPVHHHQFKDNLPYYQKRSDISDVNVSTPGSVGTAADDDVFHLDTSYQGNNRSTPGSPAKKRIKHVSQV